MFVYVFQLNFFFIIMQTKQTADAFVFQNAQVKAVVGIALWRLTCTWTVSVKTSHFHQTAFQSAHSWMGIMAYLAEE